MHISHLLRPDVSFRISGGLWVETTDAQRLIGIMRLDLLTHIQALGSITKAARQMGMSYKKARDLVASLNALAARPLVLTTAGGRRGGGDEAQVTPEGQQLIQEFFTLQVRFEEFLRAEAARVL
ncbi:LysR family transcriptional regulator [Hymenobacter sp. NST-14]|uniref:winged helix-turn-helix domain-containing protein n=1 Tax=Hymenobacter piscis TaxID=2839984 RepID=UPI001C02E9CF|nr:LysR family transcriptional regulator [Hymenobacter piscis]MBT9395516.1 LysR family transcriptional regulator [Hymenobacter piscis]